VTPEEIWNDLLAGNERFRTGQPQPRDHVREREAVVEDPRPKAVILACADSRVSPEIVFDQKLGELFVVRVAGCTAGAPAIGSIEFAAKQFGCTVLVVMGHQHCGAVKAACSGDKVTSPNMKAMVKLIRHILAKSPNPPDLRDVEKVTVATTVQEIMDRSKVLYRLAKAGRLWVVPAYYHLDTGLIERL